MRTIVLTLELDEHADPPVASVTVTPDAGEPTTTTTGLPEWLEILDAAQAATSVDLRALIEPALRDALDLLRQRISDEDDRQTQRRAAEATWTPEETP